MMTKGMMSHGKCTHENDSYARTLCRLSKRHAECNHPVTVRAAQLCDEYRAYHRGCSHGATYIEIRECQRAQEKE
ncbi:hypothetical protein [Streptomyces turgidiscabies]|uniref:hypothetical protein n=1 Tax=Streptomyces turgidiscabies TaxID=85558 RepID=UPI0038F803F0